jgi:hypothetical protein
LGIGSYQSSITVVMYTLLKIFGSVKIRKEEVRRRIVSSTYEYALQNKFKG